MSVVIRRDLSSLDISILHSAVPAFPCGIPFCHGAAQPGSRRCTRGHKVPCRNHRRGAALAQSTQRGLAAQRGQLRACEELGGGGQSGQVHIGSQRRAARVDPKCLQAPRQLHGTRTSAESSQSETWRLQKAQNAGIKLRHQGPQEAEQNVTSEVSILVNGRINKE
jgi:hypothetical protein